MADGGQQDDDEAPGTPNELAALRAFVAAHAVPVPHTGTREPIWYLRHHDELIHHALKDEKPSVDGALIEEMAAHGLISIEYTGQGDWKLTPTPLGRLLVEEEDRSKGERTGDMEAIVGALKGQQDASNPLAWPLVRPLLAGLREYWSTSGYPDYGIPLVPIARSVPVELHALFGATIRGLAEGGYLRAGHLGGVALDDDRRETSFPGEVALTDKAHSILDGWPGAAPSELAENLLAVLTATAAAEPDPVRKGRLEAFVGAVRDVGVSVTSEVLSKVIMGGADLG